MYNKYIVGLTFSEAKHLFVIYLIENKIKELCYKKNKRVEFVEIFRLQGEG